MNMDQIIACRTSLMCRQYANIHIIRTTNKFQRLAMVQFLQKQGATLEGTKNQTNCIMGTNTYCILH